MPAYYDGAYHLSASDLPEDDWKADALADMPRCNWCHTRTDERAIVRHTTDGRTLHFCDTDCQHDYYTNDEYR